MKARKKQQLIDFNRSDENTPTFIHSRDVKVCPSSKSCELNSKTCDKINHTVGDYCWEDIYTLGHLVSYHSHTKLVAYVLSISDKYMIRVLMEETSSRYLIKGFDDEIVDISFSASVTPYIASIDINGSLKINKLVFNMAAIECVLVLEMSASVPLADIVPPEYRVSYSRVAWCAGFGGNDCASVSETSGDSSLLLGVIHGRTLELIQVDKVHTALLQESGARYARHVERETLRAVVLSYRDTLAMEASVRDRFMPYLCYSACGTGEYMTSFAISDDAVMFAAALNDGTVLFLTRDDTVPTGLRETHRWRPFDGEVVWSLAFLDNGRARRGHRSECQWRHIIVGAAFNRQLKLFRSDPWRCVQTVSFHSQSVPCLLSSHMDESAHFIILSDIRRRAVYLLEIDSVDRGQTLLFKSVQEFVLAVPLLSLAIEAIVESCGTDEDVSTPTIVMKMYTITSNAFQKMRVTYISRGHRLREIEDEIDDADGVSHSLLTQVSSLPPSMSSSVHDLAISTNHSSQHPFSTQVPPSLHHMFPQIISDTHKHDKSPSIPRTMNGYSQNDNETLVDNSLTNKEEELISFMRIIMEKQEREMEILVQSVREIEETTKCHCMESRQVWNEYTGKENGNDCERTLSTLLESCVHEVMEAVIPRIVDDISSRLSEDIHGRLTAVVPLIRDLLREIMHDKKFIAYLATKLAESMEKPLKVVYVDMIRKELMPALARTMDKVFADTLELFKEGMKAVIKIVRSSDTSQTRIIEERIVAILREHHQIMVAREMETLMKTVVMEVTNGRVAMTESMKKQSGQMMKLSETLRVLKESMANSRADVNSTNHSQSNHDDSSQSMMEKHINRLIASKDFAGALCQALSLTNLHTLLSVCSRIPPKSVLSGNSQKPSCLPANNILALIQQLSREFSDHLDLKIEYLFDAVLSLNHRDPSILVHVPRVLKGAARRIETHMERDTNVASKDKMVFLHQLITSLLGEDF